MNVAVERIKKLAKEKGLTLKAVAAKIGVHEDIWGNWKTKNPSISTLIKVADLFDVSIDYLVGRTDVMKYNDSAVGISDRMIKLVNSPRVSNMTDLQIDMLLKLLDYIFLLNEGKEG